MTETIVCEWCGEPFERRSRTGPRPRFCRPAHRQRAFQHRLERERDMLRGILRDVVTDYGDRCDAPATCACSMARAARAVGAA